MRMPRKNAGILEIYSAFQTWSPNLSNSEWRHFKSSIMASEPRGIQNHEILGLQKLNLQKLRIKTQLVSEIQTLTKLKFRIEKLLKPRNQNYKNRNPTLSVDFPCKLKKRRLIKVCNKGNKYQNKRVITVLSRITGKVYR